LPKSALFGCRTCPLQIFFVPNNTPMQANPLFQEAKVADN